MHHQLTTIEFVSIIIHLTALDILAVYFVMFIAPSLYFMWCSRNDRYLDLYGARVAIHETGHLITAWFCTKTETIDKATIVPDGNIEGYVRWSWNANSHWAGTLWPDLVISLGGIVAEHLIFRKPTSLWLAPTTDVSKALVLSNELIARDSTSPPWPVLPINDAQRRTIAKYFRKYKPSSELQLIIEQAFAMAEKLILAYDEGYHRTVSLLVERQTLDEQDVEPILGNRDLICCLGKYSTLRSFVLPEAA